MWHFFSWPEKNLCQKYHNGLGVLSPSMYMTELWADKQKKKKSWGGGLPSCPLPPPPPPPPPPPWHCTWSHKLWVPYMYYQTLSSMNMYIYMEIYQNLPLSFDLHLDGLHRYEPHVSLLSRFLPNYTTISQFVITMCACAKFPHAVGIVTSRRTVIHKGNGSIRQTRSFLLRFWVTLSFIPRKVMSICVTY